MAFGIKIKKIKFSNSYTIQTLFDAIKDEQFSAGRPELVKYLANTVIVFPALDSNNQVQIMCGGLKKDSPNFIVQKGDELSGKAAAKNVILGEITNGFSSFSRTFGNSVKECERLVEETYKELSSLGL